MRRQRGFSLLELVIVVGVILIIAAIAVPSLMRARIAADESSAVQTVRQIATAELSYHISYPAVGYAPDLPSLGGPAGCKPSPAGACIVDSVVTGGSKTGYQFFAAGFSPGGASTLNTQFVASSAPWIFSKTGTRNFCIATDTGSVRMQTGTPGGTPAADVPTCIAYPLMGD